MALGLQDSPRTIASNNKPGTRRFLRVKSPIYATPLTRQISHLCYTSHASNLPFMLHLSRVKSPIYATPLMPLH